VSGVESRDLPSGEAEGTGRKMSPLDCAADGTTDGSEGAFRGDDVFAGGLLPLFSAMGLDDGVLVSI